MGQKLKLVLVGGVAGGASAAARARRLCEAMEIVLFERGPDISYANCGLPYYIGGEITDRERLLVTTRQRMESRFRIQVRTGTSVEAIDRANKRVRAREIASGREYTESYDKLILSPGAAPIRPNLVGSDLPGVLVLRDLQDTDRISRAVEHGAKRALIVGAGFIGLEMAESFIHRGLETTLVELQEQVLPPLDREMTIPVERELTAHGVRLLLADSAQEFRDKNGAIEVLLKSGRSIEADLVLLCVGVRPENRLAVDAGLAVGQRGGIRVNEHMQTSDPDIYAVGDAVEIIDFVTGLPAQVPLAGPANRQGRIAADHICGRNSHYRGTQGTAIVRVFDCTAATTGASERTLATIGKAYRKIYIHPTDHAGYYPGAEQMTLKLLFDPESGRVLGAQAVGGRGVDKRIDVLAVAIRAGLTVYDLEDLELAYAPQFGSAKDPINMAGFVASNLLRGDHPQTTVEQLARRASGDKTRLVLDVRTHDEYAAGHLPGAISIPIDELRGRLDELPSDRPIAAYCQVGQRGYLATRILRQAGFDASNLSGGMQTFRTYPWLIGPVS
jgi:NADPH-dependent 2,4-dienoyl-CoA reductase/sulfur reductase-like enzyme/rhodanese-related sulfurtransferase